MSKIILNKKITRDFYRMVIESSGISHRAKPGQFVNVKVNDSIEPLLRRPFSIHRIKGRNIELLYEVVGKATEILSRKKAGESLDMIGPLGNGFNYARRTLPVRQAGTHESGAKRSLPEGDARRILVAGGMGVAPLMFLAEKLKEVKSTVLIGARIKSEILCEREFKKLGCKVKVATDDGSKGSKGKVTGLLRHLLSTIDYRLSTIYACGPHPMLREISRIAKKYKIPAQVSLDEHMACGIGACLGCVVNTKDGYKRVCKEGPVFGVEKIIW